MERKKMMQDEIDLGLTKITGWEAVGDRLKKKYSFADFAESLAFVNRIGAIAEKMDHHPDIKMGWGYVEVEVTTHDRGGITAIDFELARRIDKL